ncbi:glycosyl hydrolase family 18 protein [Bathymodiolus septemdierum thioautotrophic gill symbiont]|uniref:chitinase n=1 Tax=endosymbiont of Bathymodiolus septemdierum str. Myojin knoll TaxID=1303921 RepID=A0A0P0UR86_9GAMM|nr:glycosyl hydrolase family 18 protein [Bathymodiolus septemdierum thioautotrophic gill symbiont]BAS67320.1 hypothetical protein BSEPE_0305 [endosymbiont of Bathymodiolus septemdierum str. Myojin knoll]
MNKILSKITAPAVLSLSLIGAVNVHATSVAVKPSAYSDNLKNLPDPNVVGKPVKTKTPRYVYFEDRDYIIPEGREVSAYYATWGVYGGRDYKPSDVPVKKLSHVYVAFGSICGDNPGAYGGGSGSKTACSNMQSSNGGYWMPGIKSLSKGDLSLVDDVGAFWQKGGVGVGPITKGQMSGMIDWKTRNPNLKVIWSLGGWSYSRPFFEMASTEASRKQFVKSVVLWLSQPVMDFVDGIDIDWEFPGGLGLDSDVGDPSSDGANYVLLLEELREALDGLGKLKNDRHYDLSAAIGVGTDKLANFKASGAVVGDMLPYLDRLGLMTYDFSGGWSNTIGFNAGVDGKVANDAQTINGAIEILRNEHNVTDFSKVSLGVGFYGRGQKAAASITNPSKVPGMPSKGMSKRQGSVEEGVYSYFDLHKNILGENLDGINGWESYYYPEFKSNLVFNRQTGDVISYTSQQSIDDIVAYAKEIGAKGIFAWQIDDDNGMLLEKIHQSYGHSQEQIDDGTPWVFAPSCKAIFNANVEILAGAYSYHKGKVMESTSWTQSCDKGWQEAISYGDIDISDSSNYHLMDGVGRYALGAKNPGVYTGYNSNDDGNGNDDGNDNDNDNGNGNGNDDGNNNNTTLSAASWDVSKVYNTDDKASYKGKVYSAKWWSLGNPPPASEWKEIGIANNDNDNGNGNDNDNDNDNVNDNTSSADTWDSLQVYNNGDKVLYKGVVYSAKWWTQGNPPPAPEWGRVSAETDSSGVAIWKASDVYNGGDTIVHNGKKYTAKWWTQGNPPPASEWTEVK